ncbi:MAG: hypothetical protein AAF485_13260, partial [Chloroflexota bacterium]
ADPGVVKGLQAFRTSDWMLVAAASATTTVMGFFMGKPTLLHRPTAVMAGLMGLGFGISFGLQNSMGRLMGLRENTEELEAAKAAK